MGSLRFQSPCGEKVLKDEDVTAQKSVQSELFQFPCGEKVLKVSRSLVPGFTGGLFQSPCGEKVLKVEQISLGHVDPVSVPLRGKGFESSSTLHGNYHYCYRFSPLAGKRF